MRGIARRYSYPLVALVVMIAACGGVAEPEDDTTISGTAETTASEIATTAGDPGECSLDDPGVVFRGELLFQTVQPSQAACSWCHSVTAAPPAARFGNRNVRGNGPALRGVMSRHSEEFVRAQIVSGGGEMPARGEYVGHEALDEFGCTELDQIVAYLYSISGDDVLMDDVELEYDRAEAVAGAEIFAETCEVCHADGGRSPGEDQAFSPQPPELTHVFKKHSRAMAVEMISRGKGNMPSYRDQLSNEDIAALIAYLKSLADE